MKTWTHPIHARGVRSAWPTSIGGTTLTNKAIDRYALAGHYGEERQRLVAARVPKAPMPSAKAQMKKLLKALLS